MSPVSETSYNVALVGASSLQGNEIKQLLKDRHFPLTRLALHDTPEIGGQLTEFEDEAAVILPITGESFEDIALAIFASAPEFTRDHWPMAEAAGCDILDVSYVLESDPRSEILAPALEGLAERPPSRREGPQKNRIAVPAHPAAIAMAAILLQLARLTTIRRSVFTLFEPASEHGQAGIDEVHQQTVKILAFQTIPRAVFDAQTAFNLLAEYGGKSRSQLREIHRRISMHTAKLLENRAPQPSIRVLQAPVFHGYALSGFVELHEPAAINAIENALNRKPIRLVQDPEVPPTPVSAADSDEIVLGRVEKDSACDTGYWIWGAFDNLKLAAINAVDIAEQLSSRRAGAGAR